MIYKSTQNWQVGNTVKVGFLNLTVIEKKSDKYILESLNKNKKYEFIPYQGLFSLN